MNVHFPTPHRKWPSRLVNLAVAVVVLALAAATFVLSYPGVHAIVLQAGVSTRLARIYPGVFDALFVVACVVAVMLRDARWWARTYAWLVIVVVVAVVGAADAVHAMNVTLPHRTIEGVVAAAPWVVVLIGFSLMLAMLRQSRVQPAVAAKAPAAVPAPATRVAPELPWAQEPAPLREAPALPQAAPAPEPAEMLDAYAADTLEADPADAPETYAGDAPYDEPAAEHVAEPAEEHEPTAQPSAAPDADTLEADTAPAESVPAYVSAEEDAAEDTGTLVEEHEPAAPPSAATDADTLEAAAAPAETAPASVSDEEHAAEPAQEYEPAAPPSAAADGGAGPDEQDAESVAPFSIIDLFIHDDETDPNGSDHPATVPGQVIDDDAPPFATAPFAKIPRLNRVRSTPTPPEDDDENE